MHAVFNYTLFYPHLTVHNHGYTWILISDGCRKVKRMKRLTEGVMSYKTRQFINYWSHDITSTKKEKSTYFRVGHMLILS